MFTTPERAIPTISENRLLADAELSSVETQYGSLPTWSWGAGRRVLLAHGWSSIGAHLGSFVQPLLDSGFAVTLFDAPGHGTSPGRQSSAVHMGEALLEVASSLGPLEAVVGHSAAAYASLWAFGRGLTVRASAHISGPSGMPGVLRRFAARHGITDTDFVDFVSRVEAIVSCPASAVDVEPLANHAPHEVLIVHDASDREVPFGEAERLVRLLPRATLERTSGLGHRRIIRDEKTIRKVVAFLRG